MFARWGILRRNLPCEPLRLRSSAPPFFMAFRKAEQPKLRSQACRLHFTFGQARKAKLSIMSTYTKCSPKSPAISTSELLDLNLVRINTYRNKTIEQENFRVPLLLSRARPARESKYERLRKPSPQVSQNQHFRF
jgi:hypothetical protein